MFEMVRLAAPADFGFVKHAWTTCFDDPEKFVSWNFTRNYMPENTLIAEADGRPASNMQLMPYRICLNGTVWKGSYISGVATLPAYRHRGLVRELFAAAFPLMQKRGIPVSLLVPFDYGFYEKFGYRECYKKKTALPCIPPAHCSGLRQISDQLIAELNRIYLAAMLDKNGYVLRSPKDWQLILEDIIENSGGAVYLHTGADKTADGYLLYADGKAQECCGIPPFSVDYESEKPFAMARLIDVQAVLADLASGYTGSFAVKVTDANIPQNNRCLRIENGRVAETDGYDFEADIRFLTQLVFGTAEDPFCTGFFRRSETWVNLLL